MNVTKIDTGAERLCTCAVVVRGDGKERERGGESKKGSCRAKNEGANERKGKEGERKRQRKKAICVL